MLFLLLACTASKSDSDTAVVVTDPTLTHVQADVFTLSCTFSTCHGTGNAGGLSLEDGDSYGELVGAASGGDSSKILVVAGDPDGSYLMAKLRGEDGIVGDPMPPSELLDTARLNLVEAWIAAGALND